MKIELKKKKWLRKPLHFIDSSVILEVLLKQRHASICEKHINIAGFQYRAAISTLVLGELLENLFIVYSSDEKRITALITLFEIFEKRKISIFSITHGVITRVGKILKIDTRLKAKDALHFSCAIENGCNVFVTKDTDFSKALAKEFGTKIFQLV